MYHQLVLASLAVAALAHPADPLQGANSLAERQIAGALADQNSVSQKCAVSEIFGKPIKDAMQFVQISENNDCGEGECSVTVSESHTFGIEGSAEISVANFGSIGGGITEEWTTGEEKQCVGEDTTAVCIWSRSKYRKFKAKVPNSEGVKNCNNRQEQKEIWVPVKGSENDNYCVRGGACRQKGDFYWEGKD